MKAITLVVRCFVALMSFSISAQSVTFLTAASITTPAGGLKINTPGLYVFTEDVFFSQLNTAAITISSNDVTIDLNGRTLQATAPTGQSIGINIVTQRPAFNNNNNIYNIVIKNGTIDNFNRFGILINGGERYVTLENLVITNGPTSFTIQTPAGIFLNGNPLAPISEVEIKNCRIIRGRYGILSNTANNVDLFNSVIAECFSSAMLLVQSNLWDIINCSFSNQQGTDGTVSAGLLARGCSLLTIRNSDFGRNIGTPAAGSVVGLNFVGLTNGMSGSHIVENCTFNNNTANTLVSGVQLVDTNSSVFRNCISNGNFSLGAMATGFSVITGSSGNLFENCVANGNYSLGALTTAAGFNITGTGNCVISCSAKGNLSTGVGGGQGFLVTTPAAGCLVQNCLAVNNSHNGFVNNTTSAFVGNFATKNGVANYAGTGTIGFLTVINGAQPVGGSFDERQIDNIQVT